MQRTWLLAVLAGFAALAMASWSQAAAPPKVDKPATPEVMAKIAALLPDKATAAPAQPRKMLILIATKGFRHTGAMAIGAKAFELMGQKTKAWETVITDDVNALAADKLKGFDAVMFQNCTGPLFEDEALRKSLLDFIKSGKGFIGIHSATDAFYDKWPEYGEMIGGYFAGHLPGKITVSVKLDDPAHPLNAAFAGKGFEFNDEIYMFKEPYSREKLRILQSIDVEACGFPGKRADADYAMGWVKAYGQGRVFYSAWGHDDAAWYSAPMLKHWMDGIQFALGDLKVDMTPTAKVSPAPTAARGPKVEAIKAPAPKPKADKAAPAKPEEKKKADAARGPVAMYAAAKKADEKAAVKAPAAPAAPVEPSGLKPNAEGWIVLFDGKDLKAAFQSPAADKWKIVDGVLTWEKGCGNLWTKDKFGDFIISLEYKAANAVKGPDGKEAVKATNSGVFLRSVEGEKNWLQGSIEIQVGTPSKDGKVDTHTTGAIYDCQAPSKFAEKPVGEWNTMVITAKGNAIKIELNGQAIVDANLDQWKEAGLNPDGSKNKFKTAYKDMAKIGFLGLQDHGNPVWYRNVKVKPLQ